MPSPVPYLCPVPVLSTAHVSFETMDQLQSGPGENPFGVVCAYPEGVFIRFIIADTLPVDTPSDLQALHRWGQQYSYHWLRLDADGDRVEGLPVHDW